MQSEMRKKELVELVNNDPVLTHVVEEMIELESRLDEVKKLPFIRVHTMEPSKQKATPAAKQYRELLQQYTSIVRILMRATGSDEYGEESPLRRWFDEHIQEC